MSTEHDPLVSETNNTVHMTSFSGGAVRGRCLQLTQAAHKIGPAWDRDPSPQAVSLNKDQVRDLIERLEHWLIDDLPAEGCEADPGGNLTGNAFDDPEENKATTHPWGAAARF